MDEGKNKRESKVSATNLSVVGRKKSHKNQTKHEQIDDNQLLIETTNNNQVRRLKQIMLDENANATSSVYKDIRT